MVRLPVRQRLAKRDDGYPLGSRVEDFALSGAAAPRLLRNLRTAGGLSVVPPLVRRLAAAA